MQQNDIDQVWGNFESELNKLKTKHIPIKKRVRNVCHWGSIYQLRRFQWVEGALGK